MAIGAAHARELRHGNGRLVRERDGRVGVGRVNDAMVGRHEHDVALREALRQRDGLLAAAVDAAVDAARTAAIAAARVVDALALRVELVAQTAAMAAAAALAFGMIARRGRIARRAAARTARTARTAAVTAGGTAAGRGGGRRVGEKGEGAMALMALDEDADEGDDDDGGERTPVENEIDEIHAMESVDGLMTPRSKLDTPHNHEKELQS